MPSSKRIDDDSVEAFASTGWETMLGALIRAGFAVEGTWPMRTERNWKERQIGTNALASSIVLVCRAARRPRPWPPAGNSSPPCKANCPMRSAGIAAGQHRAGGSGPGRHRAGHGGLHAVTPGCIEADGSAMQVRTALALINQVLDEYRSPSRKASSTPTPAGRWPGSSSIGFDEGAYGMAETLSKAKNTSVTGMVEAGILAGPGRQSAPAAPRGVARGLEPGHGSRLTVWEATQHLIRAQHEGGEKRPPPICSAQLGCLGRTGPRSRLPALLDLRAQEAGPRKRCPTTPSSSPGRRS